MSMKSLATVLMGLSIVAAGCARMSSESPGTSPNYSAQADCERQGGVWNAPTGNCIPSKPK